MMEKATSNKKRNHGSQDTALLVEIACASKEEIT
jgi:hypothetical protein